MKKLLKLLTLIQAVRHGGGYAARGYKPWKGRKWKRSKRYAYDPHGYGPGYGPQPYGPQPYGRPKGIKGMVVEAILRRWLGR
jgi:hypothetical protein